MDYSLDLYTYRVSCMDGGAGNADCVDYHRLGVRERGGVFLRCNSTSLCVLPHWLCDGANDCGDFSDEAHCRGAVREQNAALNNSVAQPWICMRRTCRPNASRLY
ncbi:hypothetical protein NFI96_003422 [Prochilodus magdalenae]|nr:hypothetical protein NFI96_003422 [Prochilodus magdalenae]